MKEYRLNNKIDGIKKLNGLNGKPDPHEGVDESMEVSDSELVKINEQFQYLIINYI